MENTKKKTIKRTALVIFSAALLIAVGFMFFKGKTSGEISKLISQALYYTKTNEYSRALDKLDEAELKGPNKEQQDTINQLREILVNLKKNPDQKDNYEDKLDELKKRLSGILDKGKKLSAEDEERIRKQKEEVLKRQKEIEELKARQEAIEKEQQRKDEEIEKLKKDLKKIKKGKNKKEQLAKIKEIEEEKTKLESERKRLEKNKREEEEKIKKQMEEEKKEQERQKQLENEKKRKEKEEKEAFHKSLEKGKQLLAEERYNDALEAFNTAEELDKNSSNAKAYKGLTLHRLKQTDKAQETLQDALRNNPDESMAMVGLGEIEYDRKNDAKAEDYYKEAVKRDNMALAYYRLGVLKLIKKDNSGAMEAFNKAYRSPDLKEVEKNIRVKLYYNMGKASERLKNSKEAINYYKKAAELDRNHENSYLALGQLYYDARNYTDSIYYAKKTYEISDNNYFAVFLLGKSYDNLKDYKNAVFYYEKALRIKSGEEELFYNLGRVNIFLKKYNDALVYLNKSLNLNKRSSTYIQHGLALIGLKNLDEADTSFKEALRINPNDIDAYKGLAMSALGRQDYAKAESVLMQAVGMNGKDYELWAKLGEIYFSKKEFSKSADSYEKAYQINPNKEVKFNLASSLLAAAQLDASEKMYKSVISEDSNYIEAREGLGDCYIAQKRLKDAKSELEEIIKRFPKYKNAKRVQNKIKQLEEVLKNG